MLFVTIFLLILATAFLGFGIRSDDKSLIVLGTVFAVSAGGTALITHFAISSF